MRNYTEAMKLFKDAQACISGAEKSFVNEDYRTVVQNSQLCIELCAKGVISCFAEYEWTHDPSIQLKELIEANIDDFKQKLNQKTQTGLYTMCEDLHTVSHWHGESVYGKEIAPHRWIPAVELCTKEVAEDLLNRAKRSFEVFSNFLNELGIIRR